MYIGIDLGGTTTKIGIVDEAGKILYRTVVDTDVENGHTAIMKDITTAIEEMLVQNLLDKSCLKSIGIGVPGLVDYEKGRVIYCTNLNWHNVNAVDILKDHFEIPVYIENDATVAGYAESLFGSTKAARDSVLLTLGTGIGGGIIINNQIIRGSHGAGSELGHMVIGENFYDCNCGRNGCYETFASATAMIKYAVHRMQDHGAASSLRDIYAAKGNVLEAKDIFEQAAAGDSLAEEVLQRTAKYLAIGIANIYNILDPEIIAIGGGVSKADNSFFEQVEKLAKKMSLTQGVEYASIVKAELGNDAGIIGAAFLGK